MNENTENFKEQVFAIVKFLLAITFVYAIIRYGCAIIRISYSGAEYFKAAFAGEHYQGIPWVKVTASSLSDICAFCILISIIKGIVQGMLGIRFLVAGYVISLSYVLLFILPTLLRIVTNDFTLFGEGFPDPYRVILSVTGILSAIVIPIFDGKIVATYFKSEEAKKTLGSSKKNVAKNSENNLRN
ncbi:MAG: hypothetical protein LBI77_03125 [Puniceicoccales bacterium]|nr:hypothetical protein [Puniceicoccales bacterium]